MKKAYLLLATLHMSIICIGQKPERPNFILILTDDIGWNDLACYGNPFVNTPNIDQLSSKGLQFQNAYLTTSSCSPSRCSIITGRYPHNTGAPELHTPLPAGQVMFPQLLKDEGYYTALSGKNHMGPQIAVAFDSISPGKGPGGEEDWTSFIQKRPTDKPFFFWFASYDAHRGWQFNNKGKIYDPDSILIPPMLYDGPITRKDMAGYYHEISRVDDYVGELTKELRNQGIIDNTYIIFMSDNGRPFPRGKVRMYNSGTKTPFIIYGPNVRKGVTEALISSIDIAPTLLELADIEHDGRIQGKSFASLLEGDLDKTRDFIFAEHNWHVFQSHERMVRFGDWMYIRNAYPEKRNLAGESSRQFPAGKELWEAYDKGLTKPEQEDVFLVPRPEEELYNVRKDPFQFNNIAEAEESAEILGYLRKALDIWIEQTGDSKPSNPTPDRDDEYGNPLGNFIRGEKPGASNNAEKVDHPGPVIKNDILNY